MRSTGSVKLAGRESEMDNGDRIDRLREGICCFWTDKTAARKGQPP